LFDSAVTKRYVAQGFVVTGLAAGGVAVWLYLRNGEHGAPTSASVQVVPMAGGLAVAGRF
jgi:hypothetical protein